MKFNEVKPQQGFEHPEENQLETAKKTDTRRPRLTLEHLGKLRKIREIRKLEVEDRKQLFKRIYSRPVAIE